MKYIISNTDGTMFFYRVGRQVGGLTAISTDREFAKEFKSQLAAQKMLDKWNGTGVGMEMFTKIIPK